MRLPWITITTGPGLAREAADRLAGEIAHRVGAALELTSQDVIVHVQSAVSSWGDGSVITITGRRRPPEMEEALMATVRATTADQLGVGEDRVGIARL